MSGWVWAVSGGVAVALHLVLVQQGLAGLDTRAPRPAPAAPQVEIMAPALRVAAAQARLAVAPVAVSAATAPQATVSARDTATALAPVADAVSVAAEVAPVTAQPVQNLPVVGVSPATPAAPVVDAAPVAPAAVMSPPLVAVAPSPVSSPPPVAGLRPVVVARAPTGAAPAPGTPTAVAPAAVVPTATVPRAAPVAAARPVASAPLVRPEPERVTASAPSLPPDTGAERAGIAAAGTIAEADSGTYQAVLAATAAYPAGPCFAALPGLSEAGVFQFETFALTEADLTAFRRTIEAKTGGLPNTHMKPVSPAQCRALAFLTGSAAYPAFRLVFDLPERSIASGSVLTGRLANTSGGYISLLLIDDEGLVQDLGGFLRFTPGAAIFSIPMTIRGAPVETQQLLMALSTPASLATLREQSGTAADTFFAALTAELQAKGVAEDIALIAFSVR